MYVFVALLLPVVAAAEAFDFDESTLLIQKKKKKIEIKNRTTTRMPVLLQR